MIHVVLPAYNEEHDLPKVLRGLAGLETGRRGLTAWVVDDGSTDGTQDAARRARTWLEVRLVIHGENQGLGRALLSGLTAAVEEAEELDVIVVMDSDNTHDIGLLDTMVDRVDEGADVVIASRFVAGGDDSTAPSFRRLLSRGAAALIRRMGPYRKLNDFSSGYRAYRASLLSRALRDHGERLIEESGFACMVELLLKLSRYSPTVREVPMVLRYDLKQGASKLRVPRTVAQYLRLVLQYRFSPSFRVHRHYRLD